MNFPDPSLNKEGENKFRLDKILCLVIGLSLAVVVALGAAIRDMNFWPSDERAYYFDAAVKLPHLKHLSQIHEGVDTQKIRWLHGKEIMILCISLMQRLMNDFESLRPFLALGLTAMFLSSVLIYLVSRRYWGTKIGLFCFFAFVTSLWPYVYILFAKHQPVGLLLFLIAACVLPLGYRKKGGGLFFFLSGASIGLSFFASTVSSLYLPYFLGVWIYESFFVHRGEKTIVHVIKQNVAPGLFILAGLVAAMGYVNWPNVLYNLRSYVEYVEISGAFNHFYYNQPFLQQWFPYRHLADVRGGWLWIVKYFFVIMPVLFPVYLLALVYGVSQIFRRGLGKVRWQLLAMIALSLSSPLMAEGARVAQYGANYFPSLLGVILLLAYVLRTLPREPWWPTFLAKFRRPVAAVAGAVVVLHVGMNAYLFFSDVFPCRMATTFLSRKIEALKIKRLYMHKKMPHRGYFMYYIAPEIYRRMEWIPFVYVIQPEKGYILLPPVTGDSIYVAAVSSYSDFSDDVFLNELIRKGKLADYAVTSFKTLANSKIWIHEEEILSYRKLILNHKIPDNELLARVWLLDGQRIAQMQKFNVPTRQYLDMHHQNVRNIGTKSRMSLYEGFTGKMDQPTKFYHVLAHVNKVGNPKDALVAYLYKEAPDQNVWVPWGEHFVTEPLPADKIPRAGTEGMSPLSFRTPLPVTPGSYFVIIYRTGPLDDENYYQIRSEYLGMI